jgi:hypothetical protein
MHDSSPLVEVNRVGLPLTALPTFLSFPHFVHLGMGA